MALGLAGLRVGEVLGMTAGRIELDARRVRVDRQMQCIGNESRMTTPKAEKVRTITVPGVVAVELLRHLRDHVGGGIVFRGLRDAPMLRRDQIYASGWRPALKKAGLAEDRFGGPRLPPLVRLDLAGRGRAADSGRRAPGRHGRNRLPGHTSTGCGATARSRPKCWTGC